MSGGSGEALSERELEILRLVATGVTNREIAQRLVISHNTVKVHLRNIFSKLGVESRTEAALVAIQNGWVEVETAPAAEGPAAAGPAPLWWGRRVFLVGALALTLLLTLWPRNQARAPEAGDAMSDHLPAVGVAAGPGTVQRWSSRAPLLVPKERFATVSYKGQVYVIGGDTADGVVADVDVYDAAGDRWEQRAPKPTAASNVGAALLEGEIYVPGGYDDEGRVLNIVEAYDPDTDAWRRVQPLPSPRCAYAIASEGGRLFLFGGWDGSRYLSDVLIYDPRADAWSPGTPLGQARGLAAAAACGGRIYVAGGYDGTSELALCEAYDPAAEGTERSPWSARTPMLAPRAGLGLAALANRLYAIGGGWNGGLAYNESYDIAADRWQALPTPILGQWRTLGVTALESPLGTTIFAMGGWTGDRVAANEAYRAVLNIYLPGLP